MSILTPEEKQAQLAGLLSLPHYVINPEISPTNSSEQRDVDQFQTATVEHEVTYSIPLPEQARRMQSLAELPALTATTRIDLLSSYYPHLSTYQVGNSFLLLVGRRNARLIQGISPEYVIPISQN